MTWARQVANTTTTFLLGVAALALVAGMYSCQPAHAQVDARVRICYPVDVVVEHEWYSVVYDTAHNTPKWVAWQVPKTNKYVSRAGMEFSPDIKVKATVSPFNYRGSGYDMGHMCPAYDMAHDTNAMLSTFSTANVAPQHPNLNRGDWRQLESQLTAEGQLSSLVCIAGPIWLPGNTNFIGNARVGVPDAFFKVAYGGSESVRAWIFPNRFGNRPLDDYRVSLDALEGLTNLRFMRKDLRFLQDMLVITNTLTVTE